MWTGKLIHVTPDIQRRSVNKLEQLDPAIWIAGGVHGVFLHEAVSSIGLGNLLVHIVIIVFFCHLLSFRSFHDFLPTEREFFEGLGVRVIAISVARIARFSGTSDRGNQGYSVSYLFV